MYTLRYFALLASVILVSGRIAFNDILDEEWQFFKLQHSKVYRNRVDERHRYKVFLQNKLQILQHNNLFELGHKSFKLGLNEYSDLEHTEFLARMNGGGNITNVHKFKHEAATFIKPDISVPESVDWSKQGAVTEVKNQGNCGSCYAFSSTGSLEGQYFRQTGQLISLSEQNIVDCSRDYGNGGCGTGYMTAAFQYIMDNGGIDTEDAYPYEGLDANCRYDSENNAGVQVKGFESIPQGDEDALKLAVATQGPISVGIDSSVLVVGYGSTANGLDYWIVKNSYGVTWGQDGYIFMARNMDNNCGIATAAIFPLV